MSKTPTEKSGPICPTCLKPIQSGESILRDDNLLVHVECFDGVTRWEPKLAQGGARAATVIAPPSPRSR
jgi:hypothetical protein